MISIVDYGMGNLRSVAKAFEKIGAKVELIETSDDVRRAHTLVVPGVGAFGDAMAGLEQRKLTGAIREHVEAGKPLLGICLGLQILFELSEESPSVPGLGILRGEVRRFVSHELKIPQMGWNKIEVNPQSRLLRGLGDNPYVYFVHSYYVAPIDQEVIAATTDYGIRFVSAIERGNLFGVQFHPEKSQQVGLQILRNFATLVGEIPG
ncbi:MAG: imidazole glycerol phosphate synthase subunit HisH [Candidatus Sumerlaea chitinivorans]|nr:imidazole glycerol phosphate synthase subunit HisH [Candidatus Sumerlaea chitinivorans]